MSMLFDAAHARAALALFEAAPDADEVAKLVSLVGSWEEMFAHLVVLRGTLPEDVVHAIRSLAGARGGAASPRPPGPDASRLHDTQEALDVALTALVEAEAEARARADAATAALGAHAVERPISGFDLHLRMVPGGS